LQAAADVAARILLPHLEEMDAFVTGGDKAAVEEVLADRRLTALQPVERFLTVPDPKKVVLEQAPEQFRAVEIKVVDVTRD
jgi:hypothetical protein